MNILLGIFILCCVSCSSRANENNAAPLNDIAHGKFTNGDYAGAIAIYSQIIQLNSNADYAYSGRADAEATLSNFNSAIIDFNKAIELNPTNEDYYNNRGKVEFDDKCLKKALADVEKALSFDATNEAFHFNRAKVKGALGDYSGAVADFDWLIKWDPKSAFYYCDRGTEKLLGKDFAGSRGDFDAAIEIDAWQADFWVMRGGLKYVLKDYDGSLADFRQAIVINSNCAAAYRGCGLIEQDTFKLSEALESFRRSLLIEPAQPDLRNRSVLIGEQLYGRKQSEKLLTNKGSDQPKYYVSESGIKVPIPTLLQIDDLLADKLSDKAFFESTTNRLWNQKVQKGQLCEAYYFAGMKHLIDGDTNGAVQLLECCVSTEAPNYGEEGFDERRSAEAELKQMR